MYRHNDYNFATLPDYSLVARFFELSPFEPWLTRDKVDRVSEEQLSNFWGRMFLFVSSTLYVQGVLKCVYIVWYSISVSSLARV